MKNNLFVIMLILLNFFSLATGKEIDKKKDVFITVDLEAPQSDIIRRAEVVLYSVSEKTYFSSGWGDSEFKDQFDLCRGRSLNTMSCSGSFELTPGLYKVFGLSDVSGRKSNTYTSAKFRMEVVGGMNRVQRSLRDIPAGNCCRADQRDKYLVGTFQVK